MACADLQKGQLKALKETSKKKSKLMWLCYDCKQDFPMFKAGKSMQKDLEALRADINERLDIMTNAVNRLQENSMRNTRGTDIKITPSQPETKWKAPCPPEEQKQEKRTNEHQTKDTDERTGTQRRRSTR
ncbi:hypothetical protein ANN_26273 [Periplaneta americana]|uniref:Uncharacterized protein n=1 Tax=Periplaneta americana TaxID=6978 RepID=A0ABQ8S696_PERAM|nr:hypothetical protein ANN_26273 [Periplaneta americana]